MMRSVVAVACALVMMSMTASATETPALGARPAVPGAGQASAGARPAVAGMIRLAQIRLGQPVPTAPARPADAGGTILMTTTPDQTLASIKELGFTDGEVIEQDGGKHLKVTFDGNPMYIWHDECDGDACRRITFYVNFGQQETVDDAFLSSYNVDNVVTKMYRESEGNIALTMYSCLDGGVGPGWIKGQAERWIKYYKIALTYKPS